jgi:hypothetical protein
MTTWGVPANCTPELPQDHAAGGYSCKTIHTPKAASVSTVSAPRVGFRHWFRLGLARQVLAGLDLYKAVGPAQCLSSDLVRAKLNPTTKTWTLISVPTVQVIRQLESVSLPGYLF